MSQNVNFMITSAEFMKKHEAVIRAAVAECLGVLLYCVITFGFYLTEYTALGNSVLIGFTHAAIMQATLLASGGHINPAVTAGFCFIQWVLTSRPPQSRLGKLIARLLCQLSLTPALVYILAQFVGSVGCIPILRLLWRGNSTAAMRAAEPEDYRIEKETPNPDDFPSRPSLFNQWKTIYLKPPTTAAQGFWIEFFVGIMIMFVYCSVHDPGRPSRKLVGSFAVGLAITGGHLLSVYF